LRVRNDDATRDSGRRILVTGANGFVGTALCRRLNETGYSVRVALRKLDRVAGLELDAVQVGNINELSSWKKALDGCQYVVHLAGRAHVMREMAHDPLAAFRSTNTAGTLNLANLAAEWGVKRFVFLSSVKVHGEASSHPLNEDDLPQPRDPYAISKWEAEQGLRNIGDKTSMDVVILRPPLIYGPGVRANFLSLLSVARRGLPLPLASIKNRRSLLYVGNLTSAILACLNHPNASGQTFLLSDGEDISTADLIRRMAKALGRPERLWSMPENWLRYMGRMTGHHAEIERLLGSLSVDSSKIRRLLEWSPPYTLEQGLIETADWYLRA
jgi:nucleoside-diphosphate-sugar epimerase